MLGHRGALAADVVEIAEPREGPGARRLAIETGCHEAPRLHLEMELELVVPLHARNTFVTAVRDLSPLGGARTQLGAALRGERVALDVLAELGSSPLGGDPPAALHPMERRIEGSLLDAQNVGRGLFNPARDAVAMAGAGGERAEDQEVERALRKRRTVVMVIP